MSPGRAALPILLGGVALAGTRLPGVAGAACLYPALGVFPGMAAAALLAWPEPRAVRWLLGLALSPVASTVAGWAALAAGLPLGPGAAGVAAVSWAAWLAIELLPARRRVDAAARDEFPEPRAVRALAFGLAAAVALPPLLNLYIRFYSDGWIHAGLAWEIHERGIPPQDPRFAGLPLNYVWFYNLYLAMLTALRGHDPFAFMLILNVVNAALCVRLMGRLAAALWRNARAASGSAWLMVVGLNAGAWLLWPLQLVLAAWGEVRGMDEVRRLIGNTYLGDARILFALNAPFAHMVSFLDKFLLGTALNTAWVMVLLYLWAMLSWLGGGPARRLAWAAAAVCGLFLYHLVPGMAMVPVTLAILAAAALLRRAAPWLPPARSLVAFGAASLAGLLPVAPYAIGVMRGWKPSASGLHISYLHLDAVMPWTLLTACGVAFGLARGAIARVPVERRPEAGVLALWLIAMTGFASVVNLTESNESKFVFLAFVPLAAFGGPALVPAVRGWAARRGRWAAGVVVAALFGVAPVATLAAYLHDPRGHESEVLNPKPGEERLYGWMRDSTDARAVFVDHAYRDLIMVKARRRLYYGSPSGPERAAFPLSQVRERRAVMSDLYGPGADLDRAAAALGGLGGPAYVVYRPGDFGSAAPWEALERRPDRFRAAYLRDGFRIYRRLD